MPYRSGKNMVRQRHGPATAWRCRPDVHRANARPQAAAWCFASTTPPPAEKTARSGIYGSCHRRRLPLGRAGGTGRLCAADARDGSAAADAAVQEVPRLRGRGRTAGHTERREKGIAAALRQGCGRRRGRRSAWTSTRRRPSSSRGGDGGGRAHLESGGGGGGSRRSRSGCRIATGLRRPSTTRTRPLWPTTGGWGSEGLLGSRGHSGPLGARDVCVCVCWGVSESRFGV